MEDLPEHGVTELAVWCGRWPHSCSYQSTVAVSDINLSMTIVQFAAKLECPECGTIGGQAMPCWPNGGGGPGGAHNHAAAAPATADVQTSAPLTRKRRSRKAR